MKRRNKLSDKRYILNIPVSAHLAFLLSVSGSPGPARPFQLLTPSLLIPVALSCYSLYAPAPVAHPCYSLLRPCPCYSFLLLTPTILAPVAYSCYSLRRSLPLLPSPVTRSDTPASAAYSCYSLLRSLSLLPTSATPPMYRGPIRLRLLLIPIYLAPVRLFPPLPDSCYHSPYFFSPPSGPDYGIDPTPASDPPSRVILSNTNPNDFPQSKSLIPNFFQKILKKPIPCVTLPYRKRFHFTKRGLIIFNASSMIGLIARGKLKHFNFCVRNISHTS